MLHCDSLATLDCRDINTGGGLDGIREEDRGLDGAGTDGSAVAHERAEKRYFALRNMSACTSSSRSAPALHEMGFRRVP